MSAYPFWEAIDNGVAPLDNALFTPAPYFNNSLTMSACPFLAKL